ncbi:MAG: hypothetical protein ACOC0M_00645 [Halomonas sp.]
MDTKTAAAIAAEISQGMETTIARENHHIERALASAFADMQEELRCQAGGDRAAQEAFEEAVRERDIRNDPGRLPIFHLRDYARIPNERLTEMAWGGNEDAALQLAQNLKHADAMEQGAYVVTVDLDTSDDITDASIPRL